MTSPTVRATLQDVGSQLRDAQAKKEQLAAQIQEVQAMLAMDTGGPGLLPALALRACPQSGTGTCHMWASLQPAPSVRAL